MRRRSSKSAQRSPAPATASPNSYRIRMGMAIQRHREEKGWTQLELADRAGFSLKYVGEVERGAANQTVEVLERIGKALEWDLMFHEPAQGVDVFCQLAVAEMDRMGDRIEAVKRIAQAMAAHAAALQASRVSAERHRSASRTSRAGGVSTRRG